MQVALTTYTMQANGQVTLPLSFRRRFDLKKGDTIVFSETEDGLVISLRETLVMNKLDELGAGLKAKGLTLEELMESGAQIRQEIYEEKYATSANE